MTKPILIEIFTIPQASCDPNKSNWRQVAQMVNRQLQTKFGEAVDVRHIEFISGEWFAHTKAQKMLVSGDVNFPFVLVNGETACSEKKINIPKITKAINELLK